MNELDGWLVIPNWPKWQSRHDRHDPWLKDYIDQLDRDEYTSLSLAERGLLVDCRKIYARFDGQIRTSKLQGIIGQRVWQKHLERLSDAGFIDITAAKPRPIGGGSAARAGEEVEVDKDSPKPPHHEKHDKVCPDCGETLGAGHLETCPRMPRLANDLLKEARQ